MDHRRRGPCIATWTRILLCYISAAAVGLATTGGMASSVLYEAFDMFWPRERPHSTLIGQDADVVSTVSAGSRAGGIYTRRGTQELQEWEESWGNDTTMGEGLIKHYPSFTEYMLERPREGASLPVPLVKRAGQKNALAIPIITIIGVQKGGTTNLRGNLLTHPMVWGKRQEVHFFDRAPSRYPQAGNWEGEGLDVDLGIGSAALILSEYAKACVKKAVGPSQVMAETFPTDQVFVDSSPKYIFSPLAPYRIKMVRPGAKFVVVLRDPTDRYFSHLRMEMCRANPDKDFFSIEEFHPPGWAKEYLARADVGYQPYTALCRGENASASDLWKCAQALEVFHPLNRGLYADQLERWYRVFGRSQIMVIDSSELFLNFTAVVSAVAGFAGLPEHRFKYDPSHEFKGDCSELDRSEGIDYFEHGGRYDRMVKEEDLFREWYRPHNERLYKLLGRDLMWR